MKNKSLLLLLCAVVLCACSFNKVFLHPKYDPYKFENNSRISIGTDNLVAILDSNGHTKSLSYRIKDVALTNTNNKQLNGWLMTPKVNYNGISIMFYHGNAGSVISNSKFIAPLIERGFEVFLYDYSGYGKSEGKAKRKFILEDADLALSYLELHKSNECQKLIIYGQSLGGHLAATVSSVFEERIDGVVLEGAFSSHKSIATSFAGFIGKLLVSEMYSGIESITQYHKPLLIIHSTEDKVIPYAQAKLLYDAANHPKQLYTIDGAHVYGPILYADSITNRIEDLLKE